MTTCFRSPAACMAALLLGGCAGTTGPIDRPPDPAAASPEPPLSFSISGEPRNGGEACFLRLEVGYPENVPTRQLAFDIEFEMRSGDGWLGVSWMEGATTQVPGADRVGKPFRGEPHLPEVMHYALMDELLLNCDQLRARLTVTACDPGPCPAVRVDDRDNLFPLEVIDISAG